MKMVGHDDVSEEQKLVDGMFCGNILLHDVAFTGRQGRYSTSQTYADEKDPVMVSDAAQTRHARIVMAMTKCSPAFAPQCRLHSRAKRRFVAQPLCFSAKAGVFSYKRSGAHV